MGIRSPSLFHHFPSKTALYRAVLLDAFDDWFLIMGETAVLPGEGWPQIERVLRTAFRFFEERPDFVRLARWEALEGGPILVEELASVLRPLFERAVRFLEREMDAGHHPPLRRPAPRDHRVRRGAVVRVRRTAGRLAPRRGPPRTGRARGRAGAHRRPVPPRPGTLTRSRTDLPITR